MLIVGELINTSRKAIKEAVEAKDAAYIQKIAREQADAGADYIDINCGTQFGKEIETMEWLVETVAEVTVRETEVAIAVATISRNQAIVSVDTCINGYILLWATNLLNGRLITLNLVKCIVDRLQLCLTLRACCKGSDNSILFC